MNLHQIARGMIGAVNPFVPARVYINAGYTTAPDGKQVPSYALPVPGTVQVQSLTADDLRQLDSMNQQGIKRAIYLNGRWNGLVRTDRKGGDKIELLNDRNAVIETWLVSQVLEYWPDWTKVAVTLQNGA